MGKREANTDLWVYDMLKDVELDKSFSPQGSTIKEINEALSTSSKRGTGNVGFPEYVGIIKDFLIVIENKPSTNKHVARDVNGLIKDDVKSVIDYAINGALFYGLHLSKNTSYKKIIALGISGDEKNHRISPIFVDERGNYRELKELETFVSFREDNIVEYYEREVLGCKINDTLKTEEVLKIAKSLHEDLRIYGNLEDKNKPLIVSGILLALSEIEYKNFSIDDLNGDKIRTDGEKIYKAIEDNLKRANVSPQVKRDKLLNQFNIIKDNTRINEKDDGLGKTPLKHFAEILFKNIFSSIKYNNSAEDYIGRFYGEFMSYSGGDGQTLGIILTPKHITELFCDLLDLKTTDKVMDPCCGTGGFLIAAMHNMLAKTNDEQEKRRIRQDQLFGIEEQAYMFTIATTNMILRGDGKSNLENQDFFSQNPSQLQLKGCTVGMMNPPYSQGSKQNPKLYEINFTETLLNSVVKGGRVAVIVPQSTFTGKTKEEQAIKRNVLKYHTLEGVITLNKNTFYGVGTNPCIGIFTAGIPHSKTKISKFINFENDGYIVSKHIGLIDDGSAKDKKQKLLDVWRNHIEVTTKFCVETTVEDMDEWLHSFYYFNDAIPTEEDFRNTIADYLTFEINMITHGRGYLFGIDDGDDYEQKMLKTAFDLVGLEELEWKAFWIEEIAEINSGIDIYEREREIGSTPYITATANNNGIGYFIANSNKTLEESCISVNRNGSVGYAFYHPYKALYGNDTRKLKPIKGDKYSSLFLSSVITLQKDKYGYGYKMGTGRLKRQKILLPSDANGNPHWDYMSKFMQNIEREKLLKILKYIG